MTTGLIPGEPVPWFHANALSGNPRFAFDTVAGRWVVLLLMGSGARPEAQAALDLLAQNRALFDDQSACFFGVTVDQQDAPTGRIAQQLPGIRWFLDYDHAVSTKLRAAEVKGDRVSYAPQWLLLDPMLRVRRILPITQGGELFAELRGLLAHPMPHPPSAPVLIVPNVLSPEICRHLIGLYQQQGGKESGFMQEVNGITVEKMDPDHKRRSDLILDDQKLIDSLKARFHRNLRPMIQRAFQFEATRIERFLVSCYDAEVRGHFRAHRDNTTKGTAHRRFACTINLNADEFEGGDLSFPEFGPRTYRAPTGGAVIFSCSLLHEARPVTAGRRYAFLPFFYDDEGARIRERNLEFVTGNLKNYASGLPAEAS
jgi:hypothetical protein